MTRVLSTTTYSTRYFTAGFSAMFSKTYRSPMPTIKFIKPQRASLTPCPEPQIGDSV